MALPADFSKIYGSTATGGLTPIGDVNYAKGWEFVGSNPPTKNDFSYLQNLSDLKSQYLFKAFGGDAGVPPIGIPFFWPLSAMPNTVVPEWSFNVFLKMNDATFSSATYPKLALIWPELKLTDCRGEFLRIWDDGRGIDAGRALLSAQGDAIRNITGSISGRNQTTVANIFGDMGAAGALSASGSGVNSTASPATVTIGATDRCSTMSFDASKAPGVVTASENRPRSIAFNLLVRAK